MTWQFLDLPKERHFLEAWLVKKTHAVVQQAPSLKRLLLKQAQLESV